VSPGAVRPLPLVTPLDSSRSSPQPIEVYIIHREEEESILGYG